MSVLLSHNVDEDTSPNDDNMARVLLEAIGKLLPTIVYAMDTSSNKQSIR